MVSTLSHIQTWCNISCCTSVMYDNIIMYGWMAVLDNQGFVFRPNIFSRSIYTRRRRTDGSGTIQHGFEIRDLNDRTVPQTTAEKWRAKASLHMWEESILVQTYVPVQYGTMRTSTRCTETPFVSPNQLPGSLTKLEKDLPCRKKTVPTLGSMPPTWSVDDTLETSQAW